MNNKYVTIKETFIVALRNHQENNLQVAENLYREIIKTKPNHFYSVFYLGTLLVLTKDSI